MTESSGQAIPLSGSTTVQGGDFTGEFKWFTVGTAAFARHAVHSGQAQLSPRELEALGQTLRMVSDGLAGQGVSLTFGVERPLDADDPLGAAIAEIAGLAPAGSGVLLRRRLPVEGSDPVRAGIEATGRALSPEADAAAWAALASDVSDLPLVVGGRVPAEEKDHVAVVEGADGLAAVCWARRVPPTAPGSPSPAEIIAVGSSAALDPAARADGEGAALLAVADMVAADEIRTLVVCDDGRRPALRSLVDSLGFIARRSRHQYRRAAAS